MKILIVRNYPSYMSVEKRTYNIQEVGLAKALKKRGHQCDILFWTNDIEKDVELVVGKETITVYYRRALSFLKNALYIKMDYLYKKYDIIQTAEYNQLESIRLALRYPKKHIVYHGPYYHSFNKRYNSYCKVFDFCFLWIYKWRNTKFITKSQLATDFLVYKGIEKDNVISLGVGIDEDALFNSGCSAEKMAKQVETDKRIKLLYIGKIEPRRNIFFMLEVIKKLNEMGVDFALYLIGDGEESYVGHVKEYINDNSLDERIIWKEKMEQKYLSEIYKSADVFLLPTIYEIFGMVLLEAMYYGMVVLTTENGGSKTLISDQYNGFILPNDDIDAWVDVIVDYSRYPEKYDELRKKAKLTIDDAFTWEKLSGKFIDAYRTVGIK